MTRVDSLTEAELVQLQRDVDARLVQLRARQLGAPGVRDPDAPCDGYDPGEPGTAPLADCDSDGHYLCAGCKRLVVCRECGKHCQAVAPSTCAPDCTEFKSYMDVLDFTVHGTDDPFPDAGHLVGLNGDYVDEALEALARTGAEFVTLGFLDDHIAPVCCTAGDFTTVTMPMKLNP